ncbi:GPO family capsid scaffolding protein [Paraburkholderia diazotrophica]|uniref:Phage capsid scaffolding protein (GPO) serine peptidase n=1 Tax=Paraburkholderia diazotrophica TaxID=667676 RepID=A0A1H7EGC9_9BURK|nr:GPO family capsid scaffolding protein [Paraburkholderia diazotrophica]SEK13006.1 Phage capsid scaffolding protein (GPO) serine peptidase [Paraburkholderia diazotrophica]
MQFRKLSLMSLAVAAIALAVTMDANAATLAASAVFNHADALSFLSGHGITGAAGLGAMAIGSTAAADATKLAKSKMFRIAVEGATTDGRVIERAWLEQIAANYSPTKYGARVNLEHYRGIVPDGPFKAYGDVLAVETRELDGEFAGKLGLFAQIDPTAELVAMTKAKQKIYTSCEIDPSFADTKQAYLIGLAVTDSPASLGTEILSFAAQNPAASPFAGRKVSPTNLFTVADETVIEFEETAQPAVLPALLSRVKELLTGASKKQAADDTRFADVAQACEALATHGNEQAASIAALTKQVAELSAAREADRKAFDELQLQLSKTESGVQRPASTGSAGGTVTTDC